MYFQFLKLFKTIKKCKKGVDFSHGWIGRGTQGHVAEPRGATRASAWHGCDMCIFIFTRNIGL